MNVELIYDADCPNVGQARTQLLRAFALVSLPPRWREWRRDSGQAPARIRGYGSPTILVNGCDVAPMSNQAACCRLYAQGEAGMAGVPPLEAIIPALRQTGRRFNWKAMGLWGPAVGIAFLPKLICPACWPAYAALVGALGLPFLLETSFLLPLTLAALALVLGLLAWRAPQRQGHGPLLAAVVAGAVIVVGKFGFGSNAAAYAGATALFAACLWNSWPRRSRAAAAPCPACEKPESRPPDVRNDP
ncbi:MAG: hypothetical protein EPN72_07440 [Nevskiaceae bacterium]|nr:MAG: hypothetical protein EPN63_05170 [Nevskiaceae bacterium]TBR73000.1 MAG: hypothetical protein EPN72_07440 [Nevskiaceae bacterium]